MSREKTAKSSAYHLSIISDVVIVGLYIGLKLENIKGNSI